MLTKYNIVTISYNFINDFLEIILYNNYFFFLITRLAQMKATHQHLLRQYRIRKMLLNDLYLPVEYHNENVYFTNEVLTNIF